MVDTAASWERLCSCSMQPHPGMTWCWGSPQRVCVQHSLYCSLPSPAFLNVTSSSSSSSTAWQSEGQHSQLPACVWNPLLSFNHCLQGIPECCTNPFSLGGQGLSTCSTQEGAGNFLTFGLPRDTMGMTNSTIPRLVPGAALHIEPHVRLRVPAGPCAPGTCPCPVQPSSAQLRSCRCQQGPKLH